MNRLHLFQVFFYKYWIQYHQRMFYTQTKTLFDDADQTQYCEFSVWALPSRLCLMKQRFRCCF